MRLIRWQALLVILVLTACGGGRSSSSADAAPTDDVNVAQTGPATISAGTTATFTAVVANGSRSTVNNLVITETLTAGYTATVTCVPSFGADCPATLGPVMTLPSLTAGHYLTLTYTVSVPALGRGSLVNQVQVTSDAESDLSNNSASVTSVVQDSRTGTYTAFAADGNQYQLDIDFDALTYTMSANGHSSQKSFTQGAGEYIVAGTQRLRAAEDLVIGNHDFGAGLLPYIAARRFSTSAVDTAFNLATRTIAADGTVTTRPGTARLSGNVLSVCQLDVLVSPTQDCPIVLSSYLVTLTSGVFTGVDTSSGATITFQIARSGGTVIFLTTSPTVSSTLQLRVGLQESAGLSWGTLFGPTDSGDWITMVLDSANIEYAVLGATTNDQAGLQKISNAGPFAMMVGTRLSDSADVYVLQATPLAIAIGASDGAANGTFQVAVP